MVKENTPQTPSGKQLLEQTKDPEYEKAFAKKHQRLSTLSSGFFALSGATFIGVLGALSTKILTAAEKGAPLLKSIEGQPTPVFGNKKFMATAGVMAGIGGIFMALSNKLETMKTVYEDRRLVHLLDKAAEAKASPAEVAKPEEQVASALPAQEEAPAQKWQQSVAESRRETAHSR